MNNIFTKIFLIFILGIIITPNISYAQANDIPEANPNSTGFKLIICDGPPNLPPAAMTAWVNKTGKTADKYRPCDFGGAMMQVQYLINVMLVIGILAAMVSFSYAGYLFITGEPDKRNQAKDMLSKIIWGFIIMLTAWFIVYQLLKWITPDGSGATHLLE